LNGQAGKDTAEVEKLEKLVSSYKEMVGKLEKDEKDAL
jgi:hypothetical protein